MNTNPMPKKGDWIVTGMNVVPTGDAMILSAVVAPVALTIITGQSIKIKCDDAQAKTISMPYEMHRPLSAGFFAQSLRLIADSIDELQKQIITTGQMPTDTPGAA